jgi:hypothetical protein
MSRKEREKRAAAEACGDAFAEARCFVLSAGGEYKRREAPKAHQQVKQTWFHSGDKGRRKRG